MSRIRFSAVPAAVLAAGLASAVHAQYAVTILQTPGWAHSTARGVRPGIQVGAVSNTILNPARAALWTGAPAGFVDLHPAAGYVRTVANATDGPTQVGSGTLDAGTLRRHALLWRGTAASVLDLHPAVPGYDISVLNGADAGQQVGTISGTAAVEDHAALWSGTAASSIDLHPGAFRSSRGVGIGGGAQVGDGQTQSFENHALLWRGTTASMVDLHTAPYTDTQAFATDGPTQGGRGDGIFKNLFQTHALIWSGSAATVRDLHPPGYDASSIRGVSGQTQVGHIAGPQTDFNDHAAVWRGTAASVIDLHAFLPGNYIDSRALAVSPDGVIVGEAGTGGPIHGIIWTPVPAPCYANCDNSPQAPVLNVNDFVCFQSRFAAGDPYANCDGSTSPPTLNVNDFVCFQGRFAAGCR